MENQPTKNIYQRLHAVMQEVEYVQKEAKKVNNQYSFVSHDGVTAKVRPSFVKHGIVYHPVDLVQTVNGNRTEATFKVRFVNVDFPDDFVDVPTFGYGIDPQDKGPGKAMSYGVKYALLKTLGLETGDDPEREAIEHQPQNKAKETPQQSANGHISTPQVQRLHTLAKKSGWTGDAYKQELKEHFGFSSTKDIGSSIYELVCERFSCSPAQVFGDEVPF